MLSVDDVSNFKISVGTHVIKFGAIWCGPCEKMDPAMGQLELEFPTTRFVTVDVDQVPSLAQEYRIKALPTLLFTQDGKEVVRVVGLSLIEPLRKILRDLNKKSTQ